MNLDDVADELYSLPPDEFTTTRTAREKEAKAAGQADLSAEIRKLRKPNAVAWLANQLAREHADELRPLLELGEGLREATANLSGQQLRELGKQQHQLVYALVQQAKRLANAAGKQVSQDTSRGLEETLHAALADETAAEELLAGRLTEAMSRSGFGPETDAATATATATASATGTRARTASAASPTKRSDTGRPKSEEEAAEERRRAQLDSARRSEDQAWQVVQNAESDRDQAQSSFDEASGLVSDSTAEVERLKQALDEARENQSDAERDQRRARTALEKTERVVRDAERRLRDASARRQRFET
ncbi:hypothetical protein ACSMXN_22330 [Jatrophihabitans sp. DSM 45814]